MKSRDSQPRRWSYASVVAVLACLAAVGCREESPSLEDLIERGSRLPGVRASRHSPLRAEFRLLEQSHSLPLQLNREAVPPHQNAAVALAQVFHDDTKVEQINGPLPALLAALEYAEPDLIVADLNEWMPPWAGTLQGVSEATSRTACEFGLRYERGFFNDLRFLQRAAAACRLLLADAVHQSRRDRPAAIRRFDQAWQWTDWLAAELHLESRLQASLLRSEALLVAEWLSSRANTTPEDLLAWKRMFERSLAAWPSDAETLRRERALVVATYEAIRLGLVDVLFTLEERAQLRTEGVLDSLRSASAAQIDADQAAYLEYMREVMAVADRPFYQRSQDLRECDRMLRVHEHQERFPWFACRLFVESDSLTLAQAELARDRGRLEGWVLGLAAATQSPPPPYQTNPLHGDAYAVNLAEGQVYVALGDRRAVNPRIVLPAATR